MEMEFLTEPAAAPKRFVCPRCMSENVRPASGGGFFRWLLRRGGMEICRCRVCCHRFLWL
jgi:transcription elongation factor Elf1